ncbi:hypothetical protein BN2475_400051 [Paraburkholderia ribeironis]|uniref:Uncharacterized protein n=1 Tax=Paraburkholderia ribeironis TaxID=1247936 RepID=A0A1N7S6Q0_9BURK|nr:hypothetical protein BN2475_400051 [Paraburkholderia ribeironis]
MSPSRFIEHLTDGGGLGLPNSSGMARSLASENQFLKWRARFLLRRTIARAAERAAGSGWFCGGICSGKDSRGRRAPPRF